MIVKKTLHEIYTELTELREDRDQIGFCVASSLAKGTQGKGLTESFLRDFNHLNEVIAYLSRIEVEYEDKYESE